MALPGDVVTLTLTAHYEDMQGNAESGFVLFTPTAGPFADPVASVIFEPRPVTAELNDLGELSVVLPCTSNADFEPSSWAWQVTEEVTGSAVRIYYVELPSALGSTADLSALAHITPP